ncbi:MAG: MBL fold metallo-hydrolase [Dehalococcoidia bacterium]|nr:MBL fold metallo-hydrolase [Dehalococcoidia bacterium]
MEITYLGHSCFKIRGKQATIVTDPYGPETGYGLGKAAANIVTVSHDHPDHNYASGVGGDPRIISRPGEYEVAGVLIIGIPTFHDNEKGAKRGKNTVFALEADELSLCHLGDLGHPLTDDQLEAIGRVDVLMVPVGGVYTIGASSAAALVRQMDPRIVLPMHYRTPTSGPQDLDPVQIFLHEMGIHEVAPQAKLNVTKNNLPLLMQVIQMEYPGCKPVAQETLPLDLPAA